MIASAHVVFEAIQIVALAVMAVWFWRLRCKRGRDNDCK